jgi:hypothetical protein
MRRQVSAFLIALTTLVATGCAATTVNGAPQEPVLQSIVEAPVPATTSEQLAEMVQITTSLGQLITDGKEADAMARLEELWVAAAPTVTELGPATGREIEHQLTLVRRGVDRNRPADTDKASRNLNVVITDYLAEHP